MGVARSVPGVLPAGGNRNLHPPPTAGDADLPGHQGQGQMTKNPWKEAFLSSNIKYILIATVVLIGQGARRCDQHPIRRSRRCSAWKAWAHFIIRDDVELTRVRVATLDEAKAQFQMSWESGRSLSRSSLRRSRCYRVNLITAVLLAARGMPLRLDGASDGDPS
jgi:hypothetical protein